MSKPNKEAAHQEVWDLIAKVLSHPGIAGLCYSKGMEPGDWAVWTMNGEPSYWGDTPQEAVMVAAIHLKKRKSHVDKQKTSSGSRRKNKKS